MSATARFDPDGEMDRLARWNRRVLDVELQGLILVAVPCADCHRLREPRAMRRNPRNGEFHCTDYDAKCHEAILANQPPEVGAP